MEAKQKFIDNKIVVNRTELKSEISFTVKGLKEAINQPHYAYNFKNQLILEIDALLEKCKYLGFKSDSKNRPQIKGFHYFEILIQNRNSYILIMEKYSGEHIFYSVCDTKEKTD